MEHLKYYKIFIDGIDKSGKDTVCDYITFLGNFKYLNKPRGIMTMIAYAKKFDRQFSYSKENLKDEINVLLDVDKEDWTARCKINKEAMINYDIDTSLFNAAYNELQGKTHLLRFNTSNETAYTIAKKILDYADRLNKGV